jgi:hypothetical protein
MPRGDSGMTADLATKMIAALLSSGGGDTREHADRSERESTREPPLQPVQHSPREHTQETPVGWGGRVALGEKCDALNRVLHLHRAGLHRKGQVSARRRRWRPRPAVARGFEVARPGCSLTDRDGQARPVLSGATKGPILQA